MIFKQEGVWIAPPGVCHFTSQDISFLEYEAPKTSKRRARICSHQEGDSVHQMLIAFCSDSRNEPHSHEKMESLLILRGMMTVHFPNTNTMTILHAGDFLRIPPGIVHQPLPVTDCVILETAEK